MGIRFDSGDDSIIKRLMMQKYMESLYPEMSEKYMADYRHGLNLDYLNKQYALSRTGHKEDTQVSEESTGRVEGYKHALDLDKLAEENAIWLSQQPPVKQAQALLSQTKDPEQRKQIEGFLANISNVSGELAEQVLRGERPDPKKFALLARFLPVADFNDFYSTLSARQQEFHNIKGREGRLDLQRKREARITAGGEPTAKGKDDIKSGIAGKVTAINRSLDSNVATSRFTLPKIEKTTDKGTTLVPDTSWLTKARHINSQIGTWSIQGKFTKDSPLTDEAFFILDNLANDPTGALAAFQKLEKDIAASKAPAEEGQKAAPVAKAPGFFEQAGSLVKKGQEFFGKVSNFGGPDRSVIKQADTDLRGIYIKRWAENGLSVEVINAMLADQNADPLTDEEIAKYRVNLVTER